MMLSDDKFEKVLDLVDDIEMVRETFIAKEKKNPSFLVLNLYGYILLKEAAGYPAESEMYNYRGLEIVYNNKDTGEFIRVI
jgi:hypothetical protein|tara:strand:+ start:625 stop:867 length:243 start_codon:yes stop_codon:yes gene_type:complete